MAEDKDNENEPNIDPRLMRLRVELFTALQTLKGEDLEYFKDLVRDIALCGDIDVTHPDAKQDATAPSVVIENVDLTRPGAKIEIFVPEEQSANTKKGYAALICGVRYGLLEQAEKALATGSYSLACELLNAYGQVK